MDYGKIEQLEKLFALKEKGAITEAEYEKEKKRIIEHDAAEADTFDTTSEQANEKTGSFEQQAMIEENLSDHKIFGMTENNWGMLMHLSVIFGIAYPLGILAPLLMWLISRNQSNFADVQGKILMNWLISYFIYMACAVILLLLLVGVVLIPILLLLNIIFPIVGAVNAYAHKSRSYPLSIRFFEITEDK